VLDEAWCLRSATDNERQDGGAIAAFLRARGGSDRCLSYRQLMEAAESQGLLASPRAGSGQPNLMGFGGGGGSRTPVREALPPEDYMLSPFRFVRRWNSERARRATD
jgi:hypothetical protein